MEVKHNCKKICGIASVKSKDSAKPNEKSLKDINNTKKNVEFKADIIGGTEYKMKVTNQSNQVWSARNDSSQVKELLSNRTVKESYQEHPIVTSNVPKECLTESNSSHNIIKNYSNKMHTIKNSMNTKGSTKSVASEHENSKDIEPTNEVLDIDKKNKSKFNITSNNKKKPLYKPYLNQVEAEYIQTKNKSIKSLTDMKALNNKYKLKNNSSNNSFKSKTKYREPLKLCNENNNRSQQYHILSSSKNTKSKINKYTKQSQSNNCYCSSKVSDLSPSRKNIHTIWNNNNYLNAYSDNEIEPTMIEDIKFYGHNRLCSRYCQYKYYDYLKNQRNVCTCDDFNDEQSYESLKREQISNKSPYQTSGVTHGDTVHLRNNKDYIKRFVSYNNDDMVNEDVFSDGEDGSDDKVEECLLHSIVNFRQNNYNDTHFDDRSQTQKQVLKNYILDERLFPVHVCDNEVLLKQSQKCHHETIQKGHCQDSIHSNFKFKKPVLTLKPKHNNSISIGHTKNNHIPCHKLKNSSPNIEPYCSLALRYQKGIMK